MADPLPESRLLLERQLARWHMQADCVESADAALKMLRDAAARGHPYDVALFDMDLRPGSGLMLAADVKMDSALAGVRVLLLASERNAADTVQRREAGVAFQLIKPPRACDVYDCIVTPLRSDPQVRPALCCVVPPPSTAGGDPATPATAPAIPPIPPMPPPMAAAGAAARSMAAAMSTVPVNAESTAAPAFTALATSPRRAEPAGQAGQLATIAAAARPVKRRKVLLAEDNPVNVEVASAMLQSLGLEVRCAGNGAEALAAVRGGSFDAVLMDCQMPVMDGMAATAEIRRHEQQQGRARLPVVAITANALPGDRETCLAAGMDDYLSKPFTRQLLGETLGRWIRMPRQAAGAQAQSALQPALAGTQAATPRLSGDALPATIAPSVSTSAGAAPAAPHTPAACAVMPALASPADRDGLAAPETAASRATLNPRALDHIRALNNGLSPSLLRRVLQSYLDETPRHLAALQGAIAAAQPDTLRRVAHSLKSSSGNVGAESLARMCKEMEQLGQAHTTEGATALLAGMEREFDMVRRALCTVLEKEP